MNDNFWKYILHLFTPLPYVFRKIIHFLKRLIFPERQQDRVSKLHCSQNSILLAHFKKPFNKDSQLNFSKYAANQFF